MLDIDDALAGAVERATEPALGAIKLAWWRERLEELDEGKMPAELRLRAAAAELLPRGVRGSELSQLTDAWATLLEDEPDLDRIAEGGARLFSIAASLLGASHPLIEPAGRLYGYQNVARRGQMARHSPMAELHQLSEHRFQKELRPLTALAALAARDARRPPPLEPEATPGRSWALMRHRVTGKV